jgi:aspartokinase
MSSISKITEDIINRSPFLRELITENLINISALARKIIPEIEQITGETIKEGAVLMAIKRISLGLSPKADVKIIEAIRQLGDFFVRVNLSGYTFENSRLLKSKEFEFFKIVQEDTVSFLNVYTGMRETTYIINSDQQDAIERIFREEHMKSNIKNLASVSITLPPIYNEVIGTTYYILRLLAWEGINLIEIMTTGNELAIVIHEKDVDQVFKILMDLKRFS